MKFFRNNKRWGWLILFLVIPLLFFYQTILFGKLPFPGDLLVGEYAPYNSYHFLGYEVGSYPNKGQNFDVLELLYPAKHFSIESLKGMEMPFWNPYIFSGTPHLASLQSGSFYPLNLFFFLLPFTYAWTIYIFIQPVLAGVFTFLFLRELGIRPKGSFFGAISFAFSSYLTVWMQYGNIGHSILWLPLLMFFSLRFIKKPSLGLSLGIIIGLTFSLLAGYIQTSFYVFIFLLAFTTFNIFSLEKKGRILTLAKTLPIFILPLLLSSLQLLPTFELLSNSTRTSYSIDSFVKLLIPKIHLATLFAPDFFGNPATRNYWLDGTYIERVSYFGIVPLILGLFAVFKRQNLIVWFFLSSAVVALFLSFDNFIARTIYSLNIPLLSSAVPTRLMFVFCFSSSTLAAFGFDLLEKSVKKDRYLLLSLLIVGSILLSLWVFVYLANSFFPGQSWLPNLAISKRNLILPTGIFSLSALFIIAHFYTTNFRRYTLIGLIFLTIFELFYFFQKITPFSPKESVYPQTEVLSQLKKIQGIDRSWGYGSGYIEPNIQTYEKIFSTDGYDALHVKDYSELVSTSKGISGPDSLARSETEVVRGFGEEDLRKNVFRQNILNLLGVKYVLHKVDSKDLPPDYKTFGDSVYKLVWHKDRWQIYENKNALNRVSIFGSYVVEKDKRQTFKKIHDPAFNLKDTLILDEELPKDFEVSKDKTAKAEIESYKPNEIIINTSSSSDSILFISDSYYPGWKVAFDGNPSKIYRADYAFRAIAVPKGKHKVIFSYQPQSYDFGLKITSVSLLFLLLLSISKVIKIRKAKKLS